MFELWDGRMRVFQRNLGILGHNYRKLMLVVLNAQRKWGDVLKQNIAILLVLSRELRRFDRCTVCDGFVHIQRLVETLAFEVLRKDCLNARDARRAPDKDNLIDLLLGQRGGLEHLADWFDRSEPDLTAQVLKLRTIQVHVKVLTLRQLLTLNRRLKRLRELKLGLLAVVSESRKCAFVVGDIDASLALKLAHAVLNQNIVDILAAKMWVTHCG